MTSLEPYGPGPIPQAPVEPLDQAGYEAIQSYLRKPRDIFLIKLLRGTGIRISEALAITPAHLGQNGPYGYVYIQRGKKRGKNPWEPVYMHMGLFGQIQDFIRVEQTPPTAPIFRVTRRQVVNICHLAGGLAIGRRVHPHEFRGLYLTTLIDGGLRVEEAAKLAGHVDTKTTMKHYYELTAARRAEIAQRIPV